MTLLIHNHKKMLSGEEEGGRGERERERKRERERRGLGERERDMKTVIAINLSAHLLIEVR